MELRQLGLVEFQGANVLDAELTEMGKSVLEIIDESPLERAIFQRVSLVDGPDIDGIEIESLDELSSDASSQAVNFSQQARVWFKISVEDSEDVTISTKDSTIDPVLEIFDAERRKLGEDDDGGGDLESKLEVTLEQGVYLLSIRSLLREKGTTIVSINPSSTVSTSELAIKKQGIIHPSSAPK